MKKITFPKMLLASLLVSVPLGFVYSFFLSPRISGSVDSPTTAAVVTVVAFFAAALLSCAVLGFILRPKETRQPRAKSGRSRATGGRSRATGGRSRATGGRSGGEVKWFDVSKGFGFITKDDGSDVFVHVREVKGPRRRLREGERVSFVVTKGKRGPQAQDVESEEA